MKARKLPIEGLILVEPDVFSDERGFFYESFSKKNYEELGIKDHFIQDNHSRSSKGVLRGMHFQVKSPQAQILTVLKGSIFDVVVDLRSWSETFKKWYAIELSDNGPRQIYMAPGLAHGFYVLSESADLHYKVSRFYDPTDEGGLIWNDPEINIKWPSRDPVLSKKDLGFPFLSKLTKDQLPHPKKEHL
jgi:dTDP-4-dehydrorhamnose 3,5-epimerase